MVKSTKKPVKKVEKPVKTEEMESPFKKEETPEELVKSFIKPEEKDDLSERIDRIERKIEEQDKMVDEIGKAGRSVVFQKKAFIKTEALHAAIPSYLLPDKFRNYFDKMGYGTDVYKKSKEWLIKHKYDLAIIDEFKKYLSEHYN